MSLLSRARAIGYAILSPLRLRDELDRAEREDGLPVHEDKVDDGWAWDCYQQRERPISEIQRDEEMRLTAAFNQAAILRDDPEFQALYAAAVAEHNAACAAREGVETTSIENSDAIKGKAAGMPLSAFRGRP